MPLKLPNSKLRALRFNTEESDLFFGSDFHFGHNKDFIYKDRGFDSIIEHDLKITRGIIDKIQTYQRNGKDKNLIILGDTFLNIGDDIALDIFEQIIQAIPEFVNIYYIFGNHESNICRWFESYTDGRVPVIIQIPNRNIKIALLGEQAKILIDKRPFYLSHLPLMDTPRFFKGGEERALVGHCHGNNPRLYFSDKSCPSYDIGVEIAMKEVNAPIFHYDEIIERLKKKD